MHIYIYVYIYIYAHVYTYTPTPNGKHIRTHACTQIYIKTWRKDCVSRYFEHHVGQGCEARLLVARKNLTWLEKNLTSLEKNLTWLAWWTLRSQSCHEWTYLSGTTCSWHDFDRKNPSPPGGFPIYYVPSSRTVCKRNPLEGFLSGSSRGVLLHTGLDEGTEEIGNSPGGWGFFRSTCWRTSLATHIRTKSLLE